MLVMEKLSLDIHCETGMRPRKLKTNLKIINDFSGLWTLIMVEGTSQREVELKYDIVV